MYIFPLKLADLDMNKYVPLNAEKHTVAFKGTCFFIFGCVD